MRRSCMITVLFMLTLIMPMNWTTPAHVRSAVPAASAVRMTDLGVSGYKQAYYAAEIQPVVLGDRVIFSTQTPDTYRSQLWVMNGSNNVLQLAELLSTDIAYSTVHAIVSMGDEALIFANTNQIWRSNGTIDGTALVVTLPDPLTFGLTNGAWYNQTGDEILFAVQAQSGYQIWRSDGTATGTVFVTEILRPSTDIVQPQLERSFLMPDGTFLQLVWKDYTHLQYLRRITGPTLNDIQILKTWQDDTTLYMDSVFFAHDQLFVPLQSQNQLSFWRSDGTAAGTEELLSINGASNVCTWSTAGQSQIIGICESYLILSDGTRAGTHIREHFLPGLGTCSPSQPRADAQLLVFCSYSQGKFGFATLFARLDLSTFAVEVLESVPAGGSFLQIPILFGDRWLITTNGRLGVTPGTLNGVHWLTLNVPADLSPGNLIGLKDRLLYSVMSTSVQYGATPPELFGTDGTPEGTEFLMPMWYWDGALQGVIRSGERQGSAFLVWNNGLWISDGTRSGTQLLTLPNMNIRPYSSVMLGDVLYFANSTETGLDLWRTDGTITGTQGLIVLQPDLPSSNINLISVTTPGILYFKSVDGAPGVQLWATDGTSAGTRLLTDQPIDSQCSISPIVTAGDKLFFCMDDGVHGAEVWVTDGSTAGTKLVSDLLPGVEPSYLYGFTVSTNGELFFIASDGAGLVQLWITDGSSGGTRRLTSFPANEAEMLGIVASTAGNVYFATRQGSGSSFAIWISDGTPGGTQRVVDFTLGSDGGWAPYLLTPHTDGRMAFVADDGAHGPELWITDGTPGGTQRLSDIAPGARSPSIQDMTWIGDTLFFTADDGTHGRELWWWDGTALQFQDLNPGLPNSNPAEFTRVGNVLYFTAADQTRGRELWGLPVGPASVYMHGSALGGPPGETGFLSIGYGNLGGGTGSVTITLTLGAPAEAAALPTYLSDTSGVSPTISGNQVQWRNLPAEAMLRRQIGVQFAMPAGAPGTRYPVQLSISAPADARIDDNIAVFDLPLVWNRWTGLVARP